MEEPIEIYNNYPKFEKYNPMHYNNDNNKISDIENSIHASLLANKSYENNKCNIDTPFKILITFAFVGLIFLVGIVVVLFLKKEI
jgi:hypothetical protein